jgi:glycosyltransferase involved in cell wall biosynthesis
VAPDVLFIPGNFHFIIAGAIRRHFPGLPIIAKVSNPLVPHLPAPLGRLARVVVRLLLAPIDRLVFMSAELLAADSDVIGAARAAVLATVIPEPNLPDGYSPPLRHGPQTPPLILVVGRMEPQKNLTLAIHAFAALLARQDARLVILGEGRERSALEALVRRVGLDGAVEMPGFVPDVGAMLAKASLLLMTSRYEGFPAVLIEALAADVPVVSTHCSPAQKTLIASALHGRVVDDATPEKLAEAMAAVLTLPFTTQGTRAAGLGRHASGASASEYLALFDRTSRENLVPLHD